MRHLRHALRTCELFSEFDDKTLPRLLDRLPHRTAVFSLGQAIAIQGAPCSHLGIVIRGIVEVTKILPSGRTLTMARLTPSDVFGEAVLFSSRRYPATIMASHNDTAILFIGAQQLMTACRADLRLFVGLMRLLSTKILLLDKKIGLISHRTLRQNLAAYLLEQAKQQGRTTVTLSMSRQELADQFGVARPSLSRELAMMKADGLVDYDRRSVLINDADKLEECLLQ